MWEFRRISVALNRPPDLRRQPARRKQEFLLPARSRAALECLHPVLLPGGALWEKACWKRLGLRPADLEPSAPARALPERSHEPLAGKGYSRRGAVPPAPRSTRSFVRPE